MKMKKVLSLLLALFCASSLFCAPAFASNSSTDGGGSGDSGATYLVPTSVTYKFESTAEINRYSEVSLGNGILGFSASYPGVYSGQSGRSATARITYLYKVPVPGYVNFSGTYGGKTFNLATDECIADYSDAMVSMAFRYAGDSSAIDTLSSAWTLKSETPYSKRIDFRRSGILEVEIYFSFDNWRGTKSIFQMDMAPTFELYAGSLDNIRNPQDYFSAGKKAFFTCPECGTMMNQSYSNVLLGLGRGMSLECPSCGKVITNKSLAWGLLGFEHSESGGDHQGTLGPDAPVKTPSGSASIPYPDGTSKPLEYKNAYTENNITYIYADDRVIEYYPASLTGNGDVYVTYEYGGDTYITVQGYTPPACSHVYDDGVIDPAPTCTTPGKLTQTCTLCGDKKVSVVPTVSHSYDEGTRVEPTCIASGSLTQTCTVCGDKKITTLPNLGHDWQAVKTVNTQYGENGMLIQQGYVLYECTRCHEQYKAESTGGQVTPPPSGGGDSGGGGGGSGGGDSGDDGGDSIWDKIWGGIGDILGFIVNGLGQVLGGIIEALVAVAKQLVEGITTLLDSLLNVFTSVLTWGGSFGEFVGTFFTAFPPEIVTLFVLSISLAIVLMVIRFFRK